LRYRGTKAQNVREGEVKTWSTGVPLRSRGRQTTGTTNQTTHSSLPLPSTPQASRAKNVRVRGPRRRRPAATARPPPPAPPPPRELRPGRGLARWRVPAEEGRRRGRRLGRPCRRASPRQAGWPPVNCSSCVRVLVNVATMCKFMNYNLL